MERSTGEGRKSDALSTNLTVDPASSIVMKTKTVDISGDVGDLKRRALAKAEKVEIVDLLNIHENTDQSSFSVALDVPLFQPYPSSIHFMDYEPFMTYTQVIYFRNCDSVSRRLFIEPIDSPFFSLSAPHRNNAAESKIAPGMEVKYTITFKPQERKDYLYHLRCSTERERFIVVIDAPGKRPCIEFPAVLDFGTCPVKIPTKKTLLIQNKGNDSALLRATITPPFRVSFDEPVLPSFALSQLSIEVVPDTIMPLEGCLVVDYGGLEKATVQLRGRGEEIDVDMDYSQIDCGTTYIGLQNNRRFKVVNRSNYAVQYQFKLFSNKEEDDNERRRLHNELNDMELEELEKSFGIVEGASVSTTNEDVLAVQRKYRNLHAQVDLDPFTFDDKHFSLIPSQESIWGQGSQEITVLYHPKVSANMSLYTYLEVSGRELRIPLLLTGVALGPRATFSYDVLDIGDIYIKSEHTYDVAIQNVGNIPCEYRLVKGPAKQPKIEFVPEHGHLEVGQSHTVELTISSEILGEFSEYYEFELVGQPDHLMLQVKGHVVGPTFFFNKNALDFGVVSYSFLATRSVTLTNTSDVSFEYCLRIPQDGELTKKEFHIQPDRATVKAHESQAIKIDFISETVKKYEYSLVIDILDVGEGLLSLPLGAECRFAPVSLSTLELPFEDCYLRYSYTKTVTLINSSDLPARFEIQDQDERSRMYGEYSLESNLGVVPSGEEVQIPITLVVNKLGSIRIPFYIRIIGSDQPPYILTLTGNGNGAFLSPSLTSIQFGSIPCITTTMRELKLLNTTTIDACFVAAFKKGAQSPYSLSSYEGVIHPGEEQFIQVEAFLDDIQQYNDELAFTVTDGEKLIIPVSSKGVGTTLFCEEIHDCFDFGNVFTKKEIDKVIVVENRGRRMQKLQWQNSTQKKEEAERKKVLRQSTAGGGGAKPRSPAPFQPSFRIEPAVFDLEPQTGCTFTILGYSETSRNVKEEFICLAKYDGDIRPSNGLVFSLSANYIKPYVECIPDSLIYEYISSSEKAVVHSKDVLVRNVTLLSLDCVLAVRPPFFLTEFEFHLEPSEEHTIHIGFDPNFRGDYITQHIRDSMTISYKDQVQTDRFSLSASIIFPNILFDKNAINFGSVMNMTTVTRSLTLTNPETIPVPYRWEMEFDLLPEGERTPAYPFEIQPIQGVLPPGSKQDTILTYIGIPNQVSTAVARCVVSGGPNYDIALRGESNMIVYRLDKQNIDFGSVPYLRIEERDFTIVNTGPVEFNYSISIDSGGRKGSVAISPSSGTIGARQSQKISVYLRCGIPDRVTETLVLEIAHFEPVKFFLYATGIYSNIRFDVPLAEPSNWPAYLRRAEDSLSAGIPYYTTAGDGSELSPQKSTEALMVSPKDRKSQTPGKSDFSRSGRTEEPTAAKSSAPRPPESPLDEALRLYFIDRLQEETSHLPAEATTVDPRRGRKNAQYHMMKLGSFHFLDWVVDFGNVIIGTQKQITVKLTNISPIPFTVTFDRQLLKASPFTIEPETALKLPFGTSQSFLVTFRSSRELKVVGNYEFSLPFDVPGGPHYTILLRANLCIPCMSVSQSVVDFGDLVLGQTKKKYVTLENQSPVTVDWKIQNKNGIIRFDVDQGKSQPGEKLNVGIDFIPNSVGPLNYVVNLKYHLNPKPCPLTLKANVHNLEVSLDPPSLLFNPIQPYSDPIVQSVRATNNGIFPVELYSVDLDTLYREEDTIVNALVAEGKSRRVPIHLTNGYLDDSLRREYESLQQSASGSSSSIAASAAAIVAAPEGSVDWRSIADGFVFPVLRRVDPFVLGLSQSVSRPGARNIIVLGPSSSQNAALCTEVAGYYDLPVVSLSEILKRSLEQPTSMGWVANATLSDHLEECSWDDEDPAAKKKKKAPAKKPKGPKGVEAPEPQLPAAMLRALWIEEFAKPEYAKGVVVSSVLCPNADPLVSLRSLMETLGTSLFGGVGIAHLTTPVEELIQQHAESLLKNYRSDHVAEAEAIAATDASTAAPQDSGASEVAAPVSLAVDPLPEVAAEASEASEVPAADSEPLASAPEDPLLSLEPWLERAREEIAPASNAFLLDLNPKLEGLWREVVQNASSVAPFPELPPAPAAPIPEPVSVEAEDPKSKKSKPKKDSSRASSALDGPSEASPLPFGKDLQVDLCLSPEGTTRALKPHLSQLSTLGDWKVPADESQWVLRRHPPRPEAAPISHFKLEGGQTRWVIAPGDSVPISVSFSSIESGKYKQTFQFEIVGRFDPITLNCVGNTDIPKINMDPRTIFLKRTKAVSSDQVIAKRFVSNRNRYEFGPVLVGNPVSKKDDPLVFKTNGEKLMFTNSGLFPMSLKSFFKQPMPQFVVDPPELEIAPGESKTLKVFVFPDKPEVFENELVVCVKDNPAPCILSFRCNGCVPKLAVEGLPLLSSVASSQPDKAAAKPAKKPAAGAGAVVGFDADSLALNFDRILVGHSETRDFKLTNTGETAVHWEIDQEQIKGLREFRISPLSGTLVVGQSCVVKASFEATSEENYTQKGLRVSVKYSDADPAHVPEFVVSSQSVAIALLAEAYQIDTQCMFNSADPAASLIDFGLVKSGDVCQRTITLENKGKYESSFSIRVRGKVVPKLIKVEPMMGTLQPQAKQTVSLTFQSLMEVSVDHNKDITCQIIESKTSEVVKSFPLMVSGRTVFGKYHIVPPTGLPFGAVKSGESREKTLQIRNDSEFPITYQFLEDGAAVPETAPAEPLRPPTAGSSKKGPPAKKPAAPAPTKGGKPGGKGDASSQSTLSLSDFRLTPSSGAIDPGTSVAVTVEYHASETLGPAMTKVKCIASNCQQTDSVYFFSGESTLPAIETRNFDSIFEEQVVVRSLQMEENSSVAIMNASFGQEENTFYFGTVIPTSQPQGISQRIRLTNTQRIKAVVQCSVTSKGAPVPEAKDAKGSAAAAVASSSNVFSVQPASLEIPAHEYRYVTLYFAPRTVGMFEADFQATVADCKDPKCAKLQFSLRGDSTLPSVSVANILDRDDQNNLKIDFEKLRMNRRRDRTIQVRNDSNLTAKCHMDLPLGAVFSLSPFPGDLVTIEPHKSAEFVLSFTPRTKKEYKEDLTLYVLSNPYDTAVIKLSGEGAMEDITLEDLPNGKEDEICFDPLYLNSATQEQMVTFQLKNQTTQMMRFSLSGDDDAFTFVPSVGHIGPKAMKQVTAYFKPEGPVVHDKTKMYMRYSPIEYENPEEFLVGREWDNSQKQVRYEDYEVFMKGRPGSAKKDAGAGGKKGAAAAAKAKPPPVAKGAAGASKKKSPGGAAGPIPDPKEPVLPDPEIPADGVGQVAIYSFVSEPAYKPLVDPSQPEPPKKEKAGAKGAAAAAAESSESRGVIHFFCSGRADSIRYKSDQSEICFSETMMLQSRQATVSVINQSQAPLSIQWKFTSKSSQKEAIQSLSPRSSQVLEYNSSVSSSPFSIVPAVCSIAPGESQSFSVVFSPMTAGFFEYTADAQLPIFDTVTPPLTVKLQGRGLRPLCHFDLTPSDYLSRRSATLVNQDGIHGTLPPSVHVIEIESLGILVKNTRKFQVMNPTNSNYEFDWRPCSVQDSSIKCVIPHGFCPSGKKQTMIFEFTPSSTGIFESFFEFRIPSEAISILFLVVGIVKEPKIYLEPPSLNFSAVLLGRSNSKIVHLVNHDHIPFSFEFDRSLIGPESSVSIVPSDGSIPPNGNIPIEIVFRPSDESFFNSNIPLFIHKKPSKLQLNVKGEGYSVHEKVTVLEDSHSSSQSQSAALSSTDLCNLDLGEVFLNEVVTKSIRLENLSHIPFDFTFKSEFNKYIDIKPIAQTVAGNESLDAVITFSPKGSFPVAVDGLRVVLTIAEIKKYSFNLMGRATNPSISFSFTKYNFGSVAAQSDDSVSGAAEAHLVISNNEPEKDLTVNSVFDPTPSLQVLCPPTSIAPGQYIDVPIIYHPFEASDMREVIPFDVNGVFQKKVTVQGRGAIVHLELANPAHRVVRFGKCHVGSELVKKVSVVNKSPCAVTFSLQDPQDGGFSSLQSHCIRISPSQSITLKPRESAELEVSFAPVKRMPAFENSVNVAMEGGDPILLFLVSGGCQGVEVSLETTLLQFGETSVGSQVTQKVMLVNEGDQRTRFQWNESLLRPNFSVIPSEGTLLPESSLPISFVFNPKSVSSDIRVENVPCVIQGFETLNITLVGSCIEQPPKGNQELKFESEVRKTQTQPVKITNPTGDDWTLHPVIQNGAWSGPRMVRVAPGQSVDYPLSFTPPTYNGDGSPLPSEVAGRSSRPPSSSAAKGGKGSAAPAAAAKGKDKKGAGSSASGSGSASAGSANWSNPFQGSLFMAFPNGSSLQYNLHGAASLPSALTPPQGAVLETPAKKTLIVTLPVHNWCPTAQKFRVHLQNPQGEHANCIVKFPESITVPASSERDCQISLFALKQGSIPVDVRFSSEESGEYIWYSFQVSAQQAAVMGALSLSTIVRVAAQQTLRLSNPNPSLPLSIPAKFWDSTSPNVHVSTITDIAGRSEGAYLVEYRPLVPERRSADLVLTLDELGEFRYQLQLEAKESGVERSCSFHVGLGSSQLQMITLSHFATSACDYKMTLERPDGAPLPAGAANDFVVLDSVVKAPAGSWDGVKVPIRVQYEPSKLGNSQVQMVAQSPQGGVYRFLLNGACVAPQPQGPLPIAKGQQITINFKNVFPEATVFTLIMENPLFSAASSTLTIPEKKEAPIVVKFAGSDSGKEVLSKMTITASKRQDIAPWVYFLRGLESDPGDKSKPAKKK